MRIKVKNSYLVHFYFHKKPKYSNVRHNILSQIEDEIWLIVNLKNDKMNEEDLGEYFYKSIEAIFKLPIKQRSQRFRFYMNKINLTLGLHDSPLDCYFKNAGYATYGIHPLKDLVKSMEFLNLEAVK